ncbi:MAG: tripartite tricarboxylate transporter TctB family protein [Paucibacter sp.]|nr:tripartite tricarboxylate transporter TctB family protein [Roseateles sp.]
MNDRNLLRGLLLIAIALAFGIPAIGYGLGSLDNAGPGFFSFAVSCLLLLIGVVMVIQSRLVERVPVDIKPRNIGIIVGSLALFALISQYVNMIVAIVAMVFVAGFAASSYSVSRNLKIAAVLVAIAFAFAKYLRVNLPLY